MTIVLDCITPYSTRSLKQELIAQDVGSRQRALNGDLVVLDAVCKFSTTIKCKDYNPVGICVGMSLRIGCAQRIWQKYGPLLRPPISDITAWSENFKEIGQYGAYDDVPPTAFMVSYRPWVTFHITKFSVTSVEQEKRIFWYLEGIEI